MFAADYLTPEDECARPWVDPLHVHLRVKGWVGIDDWGLNMDALTAQCHAVLAPAFDTPTGRKREVLAVRNPQIPALKPLLANRSVAALLERYLGGPVRYEGHTLLHLGDRVNTHNYISALLAPWPLWTARESFRLAT